ncbi:GNAT family N-acetyltransferase [Streptomyces specialis]|uniref:GNAT family N-acetyltransferase n=1 Tax=Streptomyces specialis TaxID=498367 RepID=UPI00099EFECE|nr:GNAT family N-acetyltransferase [Streptomyces specialis]
MAIRTAVVPRSVIHELRRSVLRPGLPPASAEFAEDALPGTLHLAAYEDDRPEVLACVTLFPEPLPGDDRPAHRFRGMASAPAVRGRGFGAAVLAAAARAAAGRGPRLLWCNGRAPARGFYERHGFTVVGGEFEIEGIGPHFVFAGDVDDVDKAANRREGQEGPEGPEGPEG